MESIKSQSRRFMTTLGALCFGVANASMFVGCGAPPAPKAPEAEPPPSAEPQPRPAPVELPPPVKSALAALPDGVPAVPDSCVAWLSRTAQAAAEPICDAAVALDQLDAALSEAEPAARDLRLAELEACSNFTPGWVRSLRAELGEPECADALVAPLLERAADVKTQRQTALALGVQASLAEQPGSQAVDLPLDIEQALVGLALGARLRRLSVPAPSAPPDATKESFLEYFKTQLEPWVVGRAKAVHALSLQASALSGYGRAVAAIEAATADLSFVQAARDVPLPKDMAADAAVRDAYYAALDEALEPRKTRGRDAALVGLSDFAELGVIQSARIDRARAVLSRSYAGHRIDALDGLLLPPLDAAKSDTVILRLAAGLPTFYAQHVLSNLDATQPDILRALLAQGLFPKVRTQLDSAALSYESQSLYARALVMLGQRYWRAGDFAKAGQVAAIAPAQGQEVAPENLLLQGLGQALMAGPKDAAQMMIGGPLLPEGVGNVEALDKLSEGTSEVAGMAAYDAAYILAFLPPQNEVKQFWLGIAKRYELAAKKLKVENDAKARAKNARETAKAVRN